MTAAIIRTVALACALGTAGCGAPAPSAEREKVEVERVWPAPPAAARIRYVRSFSMPRDLGIASSLLDRIADSLTGAHEESLVRPTGVAERDGVIYVADPDAQTLWIIDPERRRFRRVDGRGGVPFVSPVAVAVRPDGAAYVADSVAKKVFVVSRDGALLATIEGPNLERPAGVAFDAVRARLYVADSARHRVELYGADNRLAGTWGHAGTGDGEFNHPTHVAVARDGTLLVTDALNFRVQAFDADGKWRWSFGRHGDGSGDLAAPKGVAADGASHVFVVDALFDTVQIFRPDGTFLLAFGDKGGGPGEFWLPSGVFVSDTGRVYVADGYNHRIEEFAIEAGGMEP